MYLPSASELLRMGLAVRHLRLATLASTLYSRIMRSTMIPKCNSPIPLMMLSAVGIGVTLKVGSFLTKRPAHPHLFLSALVLRLDRN